MSNSSWHRVFAKQRKGIEMGNQANDARIQPPLADGGDVIRPRAAAEGGFRCP